MKAHHVKYTVEFDIPMKIEDSTLNKVSYETIKSLIEQSIKIQLFYFSKEGISPYTARAKNIKITQENILQDFQI
jgi:hypothetical protein